ncbi:hypothetical protein MNBD_PLANCTO03-1769, partial [hydrothermal vent metagenome]
VLVVGVLVSDHWSGARQLQLADATEGDSGRIEVLPVAVLPDPGSPPTRLASEPEHAPLPAVALQYPPEQVESRPEPQAGGVVRIPLGGAGTPSPLGKALQIASENREQPERARTFQDRVRGVGTRVADGLREGVLPAATVVEQPVTRPSPFIPEARVVEVPERQPIRHRVAKNESLYKIAAKYLGNGNRWREIAQANPGKVGKNGSIRTGVMLVIPDTSGLTLPSQRLADRQPAEKPVLSKPITYTVAKNDSLGKISQRFLGTVKRMDEIVRANADKIDDPDDIRVGMVLTIPARS